SPPAAVHPPLPPRLVDRDVEPDHVREVEAVGGAQDRALVEADAASREAPHGRLEAVERVAAEPVEIAAAVTVGGDAQLHEVGKEKLLRRADPVAEVALRRRIEIVSLKDLAPGSGAGGRLAAERGRGGWVERLAGISPEREVLAHCIGD